MIKNKLFLISVILLTSTFCSISAQTNSPYSRYGFGVLSDQTTGSSNGMGGMGYGLRSNLSANASNPASYTSVDSLTMLFDFGLRGNMGKLSDRTGSRTDYNGGIDYLTALMPLSKKMALSVGLLPFSSAGYQFGSTETTGNAQFSKVYSGAGGITQVYVGLGYDLPLKGLSLGANISYLFGDLEHRTNMTDITPGTTGNSSMVLSEIRLRTFKYDFGLQYNINLAEDSRIVLGAVYAPKINSKADFGNYEYTFSTNSANESVVNADTISAGKSDANLAQNMGIGAVFYYKNKWLLGIDVSRQSWNKANFSDLIGDGLTQSNRFNNTTKYKLGGEYVNDKYDRSFIKRTRFRAGVNYGDGYINALSNTGKLSAYNEYGVTLGIGLPFYDSQSLGNRTSFVNVNLDYKRIDPKIKGMLAETYYGISIGITLNERWFYRQRIR